MSNPLLRPSQNASLPGYGRSWLGVTCAEWDFTAPSTSTLLGGVTALELVRLNLAGTLSPTVCELFPSLTMLDVSQNALSGTLLPCFGTQGTTLSGRFTLSVFDNLVSASFPACSALSCAHAMLTRAACARQFATTIPASYTALSWMAISYNPYLYGALPDGLGVMKLRAWSGYQNECVHLAARPARHAGRLTPLPRRRSLARAAATTRTITSPDMDPLTGASPLCTLCTRAVRTRLELTPVCLIISALRRRMAAASCTARA